MSSSRRISVCSLLFVAALGSSPAAFAATPCPPDRTAVLILGSSHFDNPGLDAVNIEADDVRSPRRQKELAELLDRLEKFQPTVVAIEAPYRNPKWPDRYALWREGKYELGKNEIEQIGFRLAGRLGLATVVPVDYPMWMNGWTPSEIGDPPAPPAPPAGSAPAAPATPPAPRQQSAEEIAASKHFRETSLLDLFRELHDPATIAASQTWYMNMLLPPEGQGIYEQTDLVSNWYKRNLRILTNLNRVVKPGGGDRVLLLIGSGHLYILNDFVKSAPYACWVDPLDYLGRAGS